MLLGALLLRGCATAGAEHSFPEPPISPAWHQGVSS